MAAGCEDVPCLWPGCTMFVLGGGPSLSADLVARVRDRGRVLALNSAGRLAPWADALFFQDTSWFCRNVELVKGFAGMVLTTAGGRIKEQAPRVTRIRALTDVQGLSTNPAYVRRGRSAGHIGVNLAALLGASSVVLLGFDCRTVDGRSHFHDEIPPEREALYRDDFLPAWKGWGAMAADIGLDVINCTPASALDEFRRADLGEILAEEAACAARS